MKHQLDPLDLAIISLLSKDGKMGTKEIACAIGLSNTPTFERIKRLERQGIIKGYIAVLDKIKMGKGLKVFCHVSLDSHNLDVIDGFEKSIVHFDEISSCYHVAGDFDYSLYIEVKDMESYQQFLKHKLTTVPHIGKVKTCFILTTLKEA